MLLKKEESDQCTGFDEHYPFICISCSFVPHFRKYIRKHTSEMSSSERTNSLLLFWSDVFLLLKNLFFKVSSI